MLGWKKENECGEDGLLMLLNLNYKNMKSINFYINKNNEIFNLIKI